MVVEPSDSLKRLSEADVLAALVNPAPNDPIVAEVIRLVDAYKDKFQSELDKCGYIPPHVFHVKARSPIEAVAIKKARIETIEKIYV